MLQVTTDFFYFEVLSLNTTTLTGRVFGNNSETEFQKLLRGIWQNLPQKNGDLLIYFCLPF